jgi:large repetitive protein
MTGSGTVTALVNASAAQDAALNNSTASSTATVNYDITAPTVTTSIVADANANSAGFVHQGGTYYAYANASDVGGAGVASVTANLTNITSGATAVGLTSTGGPWTISGTSYAFRSAVQTVSNPLSSGTKTYTATATDNASNTGAAFGPVNVTVDNTVPTVSSVQLQNGASGTAGRLSGGDNDRIVITFSEQMSVNSICAAWTSGDTNNQSVGDGVVVVNDSASNDSISISSATCGPLAFGNLTLGSGTYISGGSRTFTASTIVWTASTHVLTITLVTSDGGGSSATVTSSIATYTPDATITDSAGNGSIAAKSTGNVQQF